MKSNSVQISRTSSGLDLLIELAPGRGRRLPLERALREAIREGRLAAGTPLPSSRALARDLGLARSTVSEAYAQLAAAGYLASRQGAGTWVASGVSPGQVEEGDGPTATPPRRSAGGPAPRFDLRAGPAPRFDLRAGVPDLTSFPRAAWLRALRRALASAGPEAFGYGDARGRPELRAALAGYLARARGVRASASRLLVCNGFSQGLKLVCDVLRARGARRLTVEDPSVWLYPPIARAAGLDVVPVPVDEGGLDVGRLEEADADTVLVTPAHQFPLGETMRADRRSALLAWAVARDAVVIEDDYDGEFRYDRQPIGALQGLDPDRVVYAGTAAKTLAPGLRLAWLAVPGALLEAAVRTRDVADRAAPALDQLALAELIETGELDRHVRRMRLRYRRRRDALLAAVAEAAPAARVRGAAAGLHAILELPDGASERELLAAAERRGLGLHGLEPFRRGASAGPQSLVVGYGTPPEHAFQGALRELGAVLAAGGVASQSRSHS